MTLITVNEARIDMEGHAVQIFDGSPIRLKVKIAKAARDMWRTALGEEPPAEEVEAADVITEFFNRADAHLEINKHEVEI